MVVRRIEVVDESVSLYTVCAAIQSCTCNRDQSIPHILMHTSKVITYCNSFCSLSISHWSTELNPWDWKNWEREWDADSTVSRCMTVYSNFDCKQTKVTTDMDHPTTKKRAKPEYQDLVSQLHGSINQFYQNNHLRAVLQKSRLVVGNISRWLHMHTMRLQKVQ